MADYILSERAKKDLVRIANYTEEKWSEEKAEKYIRMLLTECSEHHDGTAADVFGGHLRAHFL